MNKPALSRFPLDPLVAERWSPLAFAARPIEPAKLGSLFEAARWAPSCYNEQPWRFLAATRDDVDGHARLLSCIVEANARWAANAPLLILSVASLAFTRNQKPNRHAQHDVGLAAQNLVIQAQAMGLCVHQMGGFDAQKARELCAIPDGFEPMAMIAVGYRAPADSLPEDLQARENAPRERNELTSILYGADWGSGFSGL